VSSGAASGRSESKLRAFRSADLEPVHRLIHATIDAGYTGVYRPRAVRFFKDYHTPERILERQAEGEVVVVERDDDVIATGAIVGDHIIAVFVHPRHQRQGVGALVMDALEDSARAAGRPSVSLDVSLPSRHFYESRGYGPMESCSIDVGGSQRLDYWTARKDLHASGTVLP
jgi:GNAT superfamily N-acetyltransferase